MGRNGLTKGENIARKADLHCHILPYVDDGAFDKDESLDLLREFVAQGADIICCTPHLRRGMFETPDENIILQWNRLKERAVENGIQADLFLSREYHADSLFYERLDKGELIPMGESNTILIEFYLHPLEVMLEVVNAIKAHGYSPLVAHVERYPAVYGETERVRQLIDAGAKIQVNAGSVLGRDGGKQKAWTKALMKENLVHVVASDAHDPKYRPPEHEKAYKYISRKFGASYAKELMYDTPVKVLFGDKGEL